jgi:hypothetical protein
VRWLSEQGKAAEVFATEFGDEEAVETAVREESGDDAEA